jgi:hypothetical protein
MSKRRQNVKTVNEYRVTPSAAAFGSGIRSTDRSIYQLCYCAFKVFATNPD